MLLLNPSWALGSEKFKQPITKISAIFRIDLVIPFIVFLGPFSAVPVLKIRTCYFQKWTVSFILFYLIRRPKSSNYPADTALSIKSPFL